MNQRWEAPGTLAGPFPSTWRERSRLCTTRDQLGVSGSPCPSDTRRAAFTAPTQTFREEAAPATRCLLGTVFQNQSQSAKDSELHVFPQARGGGTCYANGSSYGATGAGGAAGLAGGLTATLRAARTPRFLLCKSFTLPASRRNRCHYYQPPTDGAAEAQASSGLSRVCQCGEQAWLPGSVWDLSVTGSAVHTRRAGWRPPGERARRRPRGALSAGPQGKPLPPG